MRGARSRAALLIATLVVTLGIAYPAPAQAAGDSLKSVESLRGCMETQGQGDILFLLDQSRSLGTTDPAKARADASIYLAERMADFAQRNKVDLYLAVAGFDATFNPSGGWEGVSTGSATATTETLRTVASSATGWETDYWNALEGARRHLSEQAGGDQDRCQAIVWFSDGAYDLDVRDSAAERSAYGVEKPYLPGVTLDTPQAVKRAEAAGQRAICRKGGLADQLRAADVYLIGIGLQGGGRAKDFDLIASIATGTSGTEKCGELDGSRLGSFALVTDIDDLIFIFDDVDETVPCRRIAVRSSSGASGGCQFVTDASVRRARILAGSKLPDAHIEVRSPAGGKPVVIKPGTRGSTQLGTVAVAWRPVSATAVEITAEPAALTDESWSGTWSINFVAPDAPGGSKARANVHLDGDLAPVLSNADSLDWRVGGVLSDLEFGLVHRGTKTTVNPGDVKSDISFDATLTLPGGAEVPLVSGAGAANLADPVPVDLTTADTGSATLKMRLSVTTSGSDPGTKGTGLPTQTATRKLTLLPPLDYPDVPNATNFGTTEGTGPVAASLPITGSGCVWLDRTSITTSPEGSEPVAVTATADSPKTCVKADGTTPTELTLNLVTSQPDNGAIWGTAMIKLAPPDETGAAVTKVVTFTAEVRKPVDVVYRWWLAILLTTLGIAGPVALLFLIAWWQARIPPTGLMVGWLGLQMRDDRVVRQGTSSIGITADPEEFHFVGVSPPGQRHMRLPVGDVSLRTTTRNPLDPHVVVEAPGAQVRTRAGGDRLPLSVAGNWALAVDPAGYLNLLVILPSTASATTRAAVLADAQAAIDRMIPDLNLPVRQPDLDWEVSHSSTEPLAQDGTRTATRGLRRRGRGRPQPGEGPQSGQTPQAPTPTTAGDDDEW